eukprot:TRINITY_DN928_c0_g1_i3.p1 TRINITY_DN928_c0_g1~~TRINITY_DN928_c0_g1_i3.p1  ORF type:complete len:2094 (-),score=618.62 TRINITY_DN928_c0_g1_i3:183-5534(-)
MKQLKKLRLQMGKMVSQDDWITEMGLDKVNLRQNREAELNAGPDYTIHEAVERNETGWINKSTLPAGVTPIEKEKYREVIIPAQPKPQVDFGELVPITAFDEFARCAFGSIKSLNPLQSKVFDAAYHNNTNLLVCAPTGAGKTNVAMMTILRELGQHYRNGILYTDEFKIIYVAPMKALAAEMTANFGSKLAPLGITVKELTGDMQLTKKEITETQVIITTPEKWDVITRKSSDVALTQLVKLLIIDEVHLLNEDRGPVIESLVARTLRQVEQSQSMIRIVGLSATLPNYRDVALFLRVDPEIGLYYFDQAYRPVPLETHFIGVKGKTVVQNKMFMEDIAFEKAFASVHEGNQVMIFVHSRKDTAITAQSLIEIAKNKGLIDCFCADGKINSTLSYQNALMAVGKSRNRELKEIFPEGFGIHHAGMLRQDRSLVERLFMEGHIKVLCCTATLAWGVNLPAHTVIIKGTQIYEPGRGGFVDLGMLDVMQIFGRAGRPQFDTSGEAMIITTYEKLPHYLSLLTHQMPIESQFINRLADHLNAEIVLGTVSNLKEAIVWLSYTYLYIRMLKNPLVYGATINEKELDPRFVKKRSELIAAAARRLDKCKMIRYDERVQTFAVTDLGRIASHFYIQHETIEHFNQGLKSTMSDSQVFDLVAQATEFDNIMLREDETGELMKLEQEDCFLTVKGGPESRHGKVNILLQSYISKTPIDSFSLVSDMSYIAQNAGRIFRALFEEARMNGWPSLAAKLLNLCKMIDKRMWSNEHPLKQFDTLNPIALARLEEKKLTVETLREMESSEVGDFVRGRLEAGKAIKKAAFQFPKLEIESSLSPITRTIIRVTLTITADFTWSDRIHGTVEPWWLWVEDDHNESIHHSEYFLLHKKQKDEEIKVTFIMPIFSDKVPSQYYLHVISDRWLNADAVFPLSFKGIVLPEQQPPHTELLSLQPLPLRALNYPDFEKIYKFTHFNRVQTQTFFTMYHTDANALIGAPTGSGKTIVAELAMLRLLRDTNLKIVYIGPLKALVRERLKDWEHRFGEIMGKQVIELTGDFTPDMRALQKADIILTTPEKWDGISRNWQQRSYVKKVGLMIMDEIHLLGVERGAILEVIVSRMRYISSQTETPIRFVGLSTALANPEDLGDWLGIEPPLGLYNFHPSVRPVPIRIHLNGFPGKHYCPRMNSMNKPAYSAILSHSPLKPVLVFVSSRRQTRLTAMDLIQYAVSDENPKQFLHMSEEELSSILPQIHDTNLQHTISFGIGLHHAGLKSDDRVIVENLFKECKIQILVSTSTLAWGVNLPAHLVIIKGTEFYDAKTRRYVDMNVTDVLQMMGRAGRPQYDHEGVALVMVEQSKKNFYKKFLFDPFPVESNLKQFLHDHINAEICSGTISSKQDAVDYITWTYLFRRLEQNPTYYGLSDASFEEINRFLSEVVDETIQDLELAHCVEIDDTDNTSLYPTTLGRISSYYYLHYKTMEIFFSQLNESVSDELLLNILCSTSEYEDLPVRHNEDLHNKTLAEQVPWTVDMSTMDSPHTKANLLLQSHWSGIRFPISDFYTDLKSVLDQSVRILQAMVDVAADSGWLFTTLKTIELMQMVIQGYWSTDSTLKQVGLSEKAIDIFARKGITCIPELLAMPHENIESTIGGLLSDEAEELFWKAIKELPRVNVETKLDDVLEPGAEAELSITLTRISKVSRTGIFAPKFPKWKEEGWWLILGDANTGELLALRRITFQQKTNSKLIFDAPTEEGSYTYYLYFMADSYLGLDQQYEINFEVKQGNQTEENNQEDMF